MAHRTEMCIMIWNIPNFNAKRDTKMIVTKRDYYVILVKTFLYWNPKTKFESKRVFMNHRTKTLIIKEHVSKTVNERNILNRQKKWE